MVRSKEEYPRTIGIMVFAACLIPHFSCENESNQCSSRPYFLGEMAAQSPVISGVGQAVPIFASLQAGNIDFDCPPISIPIQMESSPSVELNRVGDQIFAIAQKAGSHLIRLYANAELDHVRIDERTATFQEKWIRLIAVDGIHVEGQYPPITSLGSSDTLKGCAGQMVATGSYLACTFFRTRIFSNDLGRILPTGDLKPKWYGIGGDGTLLARAVLDEPPLLINEFGEDGEIIRETGYQPPANPTSGHVYRSPPEDQPEPSPSNWGNNVAVQDDLIAMTDLLAGIYILRYHEGSVTELSRTYAHELLGASVEKTGQYPIALDGDLMYVFSGIGLIHPSRWAAYDISDPRNPKLLGNGALEYILIAMSASNGLVWLADLDRVQVRRLQANELVTVAEIEFPELLPETGTLGFLNISSWKNYALVSGAPEVFELRHDPGGTISVVDKIRMSYMPLSDEAAEFRQLFSESSDADGLALLPRRISFYLLSLSGGAFAEDGTRYIGGPDFIIRYSRN